MEFWEGAILVVGGLFLVTEMTKKKTAVMPMPVNASLAMNPSGLSAITNTAGTSYIVAGESLTAPAPSIQSNAIPVHNPIIASPVSAPLRGTAVISSVPHAVTPIVSPIVSAPETLPVAPSVPTLAAAPKTTPVASPARSGAILGARQYVQL